MRPENTLGSFRPGRLVATRGLLDKVPQEEFMTAFFRHLHCDWGDLCESDWALNNESVKMGGRILSAYRAADGAKFWIITEADRSVTTILLPEEY